MNNVNRKQEVYILTSLQNGEGPYDELINTLSIRAQSKVLAFRP